jgi:hypothetical protein
MTKFLAGAALGALLAVSAAGASQAATIYQFTLDGCSISCGAGPFGEVQVTGDGTTSVDFTVLLYGTNTFHDTNDPQHHALAFSFSGDPTITISGLPSPFTTNAVQAAGSHAAAPFGSFDYVIKFPHDNHPPALNTFSFTATGASALTLRSNPDNGVFFATDIWGDGGNTGNVGALGPSSGTPEPASWALMIAGFGGVGAILRRRRLAAAV